MKIQAIIPEDSENPKRYLIEATTDELDTIRGAAGTSQVTDRYRVGYEIQPAVVFRTASELSRNLDRLKALPDEMTKIAEATQSAITTLESDA